MTKEEVLELSYAATDLHAFANMIEQRVRRQEREECAKIADGWSVAYPHPSKTIGELIRARGKE